MTRFPEITTSAKTLCLAIWLAFAGNLNADLLGNADSGYNPVNNTSGLEEDSFEFLDIEDAYILDIEPEEKQWALVWQIANGYYLYGHQFTVSVSNSIGETIPVQIKKPQGEILWDDYFEKEVEQFRESVLLTATFSTPLTKDQPYTLIAGFQGCADAGLCYPPETRHYTINLTNKSVSRIPAATSSASDKQITSNTSESSQNFFVMFLFAFLGGLILNLMPCVFPVLSIKVLSFTNASAESKAHLQRHGWMYTLGVLVSFLLFASLLISLRKGGEIIGWGFQLQSPIVIAYLSYLFFVLGLSFSGFINAGARLMGFGQQWSEGIGMKSSFFTGVLAVIVSSPCSVPFMGVALGYALTQPTLIALIIFSGLGLGLAAPFLLLTYWPGFIERLPKPGPWMERFKELLAFPLYLASVWLIWVLGNQTDSTSVALILCGLVTLCFALWLSHGGHSKARTLIVSLIVIISLGFPFAINTDSATNTGSIPDNAAWEHYSADLLNQYLLEGKPVFIELTADWCITCLMNEKIALSSDAVKTAMKDKGVKYLRGDWTNSDSEITRLLNRFNRAGVPLYLVFMPGTEQPEILPQILTEGLMLDTLNALP